MKSINTVKLTIQSLPENIALARVFVAAFIAQVDLTVDELEDIKVAVSEAVSNAIIHGYEQRGDQWVDIIVTRFDDYFEITVKDTGKGIENIEQAMEPTYSTDADRMGLGFVFMQSFMDEVAVTSEVNKGTSVTLRKYVAANQDAPN
ncbi:MAG: anti-sigma F factor [Clostridia bacterium]|jgi:stage II sporulation protein AB (anti-sigma F factor)|nr:anti-sigma F factor [Clostridia bacterium]